MESLNSRIYEKSTLTQKINQWRLSGEKIVFTNGCFDLLHEGHLKLLQEAKGKGSKLIVALNSDQSVQRLKGEDRPIKNEKARSLCMAAILFVDAVILFEEDTPKQLIQWIKPDVLVKGGDYDLKEVVGADEVIRNGGEVHLVNLVEGKSSSALIQRSKE